MVVGRTHRRERGDGAGDLKGFVEGHIAGELAFARIRVGQAINTDIDDDRAGA